MPINATNMTAVYRKIWLDYTEKCECSKPTFTNQLPVSCVLNTHTARRLQRTSWRDEYRKSFPQLGIQNKCKFTPLLKQRAMKRSEAHAVTTRCGRAARGTPAQPLLNRTVQKRDEQQTMAFSTWWRGELRSPLLQSPYRVPVHKKKPGLRSTTRS
jgi:hypothetical protein